VGEFVGAKDCKLLPSSFGSEALLVWRSPGNEESICLIMMAQVVDQENLVSLAVMVK